MDAVELWAAVQLTALGGDTEGLLGAAAAAGLHLRQIEPLPGGFAARCAAWHYLPLAGLARRRRVRLRVTRRRGLWFRLRPLARRAGLWVGLAVFLPLLLWARGLVWAVEYPGMTPGQEARAAAALRTVGLEPGAPVTQALLTAGEYALLEGGEFAWASVNFFGGRLTVEAAPARNAPEIFSGNLQGLKASAAGVVTEINLKSGTPLVTPGATVTEGQTLIGTSRTERDGTLIYQPAAGSVLARFEWSAAHTQALESHSPALTGEADTRRVIRWAGRELVLPFGPGEDSGGLAITRHIQPDLWGLPLPFSVEETTFYQQQPAELRYSDETALALARLACLQALEEEYPDAQLVAQRENVQRTADAVHYDVVYTVIADIAR